MIDGETVGIMSKLSFLDSVGGEGYTQEKLADKLGVATSYIGQIEAAGMYKPISLTTLLRIAQALDTPVYKFLDFQH